MLFTPANSTAQLPARSPLAVLSDILQSVSALFEHTRPDIRHRTIHGWWLIGLMFAGGWVRFWGLGDVGLHGDEETMALAVQHILIDGRPILPSGMFYPRGMTQLYLMALSAAVFGESEWALRLPSAICGVFLIALSYVTARRFLRPQWSLALAATVAFLPELIAYSQTARMYIFLVTCVTAALVCLFEWERTERYYWLVAAVAIMIIALDMQLLAIGAVIMFLLPGMLHGDGRRLTYGVGAAVVVAVSFVFINYWTNAQYPVPPPEFTQDIGPSPWQRAWAPPSFALTFDMALWISGLVGSFLALRIAQVVNSRRAAIATVVLLFVGMALQLLLFYHLAALSYLTALTIALRNGSKQLGLRVVMFSIAAAVIALIHATLIASTPGSVAKVIGAMVGQPSVWPYVRVAQLSEAAGVLVAALLLWGVYRFTQRKRVPDYWLVAMLGVFPPVCAIGLFAWNVPTRYMAVALPSMLLAAFAFAQHGVDWISSRLGHRDRRWAPAALAPLVVATLAVNPVASAAVINSGYRNHPDHKGAAEFMRSLPLTDEDIVLAEDVLQQTYYLGKVDYWLIGPYVAAQYVKGTDHGLVDFYTGTPVIFTPEKLSEILSKNRDRRIFVIGSGEGQSNKRRGVRGDKLHQAIESERFEVIFTGRDGLTQILKAVPEAVTRAHGPRTEAALPGTENEKAATARRSNAHAAALAHTE